MRTKTQIRVSEDANTSLYLYVVWFGHCVLCTVGLHKIQNKNSSSSAGRLFPGLSQYKHVHMYKYVTSNNCKYLTLCRAMLQA